MSAKLYTTLLRNIETIISDLIHLLGLGLEYRTLRIGIALMMKTVDSRYVWWTENFLPRFPHVFHFFAM